MYLALERKVMTTTRDENLSLFKRSICTCQSWMIVTIITHCLLYTPTSVLVRVELGKTGRNWMMKCTRGQFNLEQKEATCNK